jgi:2-amino-4-hydroxy-6-hydroxymethyldihydropteridine diphosphokinase
LNHHILISVGSNIDKEQNTILGLQALAKHFQNMQISTIYESESVGFSGNNFYNLVVSCDTSYSVETVCKTLKDIENELGRVRDKKFGNRTMDLDLLTFDELVCETPVVLPRPEIEYNAFVLKPMAELAPNSVHPVNKKTYQALWQAYSNDKQRLWPSTLTWNA